MHQLSRVLTKIQTRRTTSSAVPFRTKAPRQPIRADSIEPRYRLRLNHRSMCKKASMELATTPSSERTTAIRDLVDLLAPLVRDKSQSGSPPTPPVAPNYEKILSAMQHLTHTLIPDCPLFTEFHDGEIHDPLGGGSYAFQKDIVKPVLRALVQDEDLCEPPDTEPTPTEATNPNRLPSRPIVIHAGLQPNNSPHVGTLVVFCYAFVFAQAIRDRMAEIAQEGDTLPCVTVLITFVDTAPVKGEGTNIDGIQYQKSHRDIPDALSQYMADYMEVLRFLSTWSGIPFTKAFQSDLFSDPAMPSLLNYMLSREAIIGPQLSPKYDSLALRAACPVAGCGLAEKHGRFNQYTVNSQHETGAITFRCPDHGPHTIRLSHPEQVARIEANTPTRNLLRSMTHLLDTRNHHIRITGSDYAGMYQETLLYRPLAAWSAITGLARGRTPHILYAPLITDWSGAKLSKSLYVRDNAYAIMKLFGMDGLCSYAQLKQQFGGDGAIGLRRIWDEVQSWVADPKKLFRTFSVAYLQRVVMKDESV